MSVDVSLEFTPNPNTLKFVVSKILMEKGAASYPSAETTNSSPLAKKLFAVPGLTSVMIGRNFITISKREEGEWENIYQLALTTIQSHLDNNELIVDQNLNSAPVNHETASGDIAEAIKKVLDEEIRPAVAMDGGDITFDKYEDGVVYLFLQGSCSGCPSSTMTLKMGIETRLKELLPEIKEVVAI